MLLIDHGQTIRVPPGNTGYITQIIQIIRIIHDPQYIHCCICLQIQIVKREGSVHDLSDLPSPSCEALYHVNEPFFSVIPMTIAFASRNQSPFFDAYETLRPNLPAFGYVLCPPPYYSTPHHTHPVARGRDERKRYSARIRQRVRQARRSGAALQKSWLAKDLFRHYSVRRVLHCVGLAAP